MRIYDNDLNNKWEHELKKVCARISYLDFKEKDIMRNSMDVVNVGLIYSLK